jgi:hypothetical protein
MFQNVSEIKIFVTSKKRLGAIFRSLFILYVTMLYNNNNNNKNKG